MKYLWLLSLRSVKANKWRSLVNITVIACSVAMVVITSGLCEVLFKLQQCSVLAEYPTSLTDAEAARILAEDWGMNMLQAVSSILNGVMLTVAAFSIYGAFAVGMQARAKMMAQLMTVGATGWQKSFVTVAEVLMLALIGIPLGILVGVAVILHIALQLEQLYLTVGYPMTSVFTLDGIAILKVIGIGILVVLIAAVISIIKASRRSIIGLVKTTAGVEIALKPSVLDWIMWRLFGKAGELASANYVNQKRNYRFLSLSFAIAMVLYVNGSLLIPYFSQMGSVELGFEDAQRQLEEIVNFAVQSIVLLAVLNTFCMFGTNFQSRKGEFAIYQSIGMSVGMMYRMVALEWVYRGFFLLFYGFIGSYALNFAIYSVLSIAGVAKYLINPIEQLLYAVLAVVVITVIMTVVMITKLRRMDIVETLKATR